jgi:glycosyltransferase involved in cell wall biosynthesis
MDRWLGERVVRRCDRIIAVCQGVRRELEDTFGSFIDSKTGVITNGFSREFYEKVAVPQDLSHEFVLGYVGSMYWKYDLSALIAVLNNLCSSVPGFADSFRFRICGRVDEQLRSLLAAASFGDRVEFVGYRSYLESLAVMRSSSALLLYVIDSERGKNIPTGKLYEYLGAGRPILALAPQDSDAAKIIRETEGGTVVAPNDAEGIEKSLSHLYRSWQQGQLKDWQANSQRVMNYEMHSLTRRLSGVLDEVSQGGRRGKVDQRGSSQCV